MTVTTCPIMLYSATGLVDNLVLHTNMHHFL
jgi:hypothetical protein